MGIYEVIDAQTGEVVHSEVTPEPERVDVEALKAKLAKATSTAGLKAVLGDVLDALDQQP